MTASTVGTPGYLATEAGHLYTVLHEPTAGTRDVAVLICPPFGWDDNCSYRARRAWATELAEAGYTVLRFDLPGSGESHPLDDGDALPVWIAAVTTAAAALKDRSASTRITALGLGLGGLLAVAAVGAGAPIDDLVLWAVPGRGRSAVRELRAFSQLQVRAGDGGAEGDLWVNGYCLQARTLAALESLDLRAADLPSARGRALLLGRDRLRVDGALVAALEGSFTVELAAGDGWTAMHGVTESVVPHAVMAMVMQWLRASSAAARPREGGTWPSTSKAAAGDASVELVGLATPRGPMSAVVTRPVAAIADLCVVYLNAGATRRSGPSGIWAEAAHADAARGFASVRLDLLSLGDSDGDPSWTGGEEAFYSDACTALVVVALDRLAEHDLPSRFLLVGLCSGSYWSFHIGQTDPRVVGVVLFNPRALVWEERLLDVRVSQEASRLLRAATWKRIVSGRASPAHAVQVLRAILRRAMRALVTRVRRHRGGVDALVAERDELCAGLDRLRDNETVVHLAFSEGEPLERELAAAGVPGVSGRWPNLVAHHLGGPPGAHTLGPPVLREAALSLLRQAVEDLTANHPKDLSG